MTDTDRDAIVGARYMDTVFNSEFVIVSIESNADGGVPDTDEITVMVEFEDRDYNRYSEVTLERFQEMDGIYIVDVPAHAQ